MAKTKSSVFECQHCGNTQSRLLGKCPNCKAFNSFIELNREQQEALKLAANVSSQITSAKAIKDIEIEQIKRVATSDAELDLVLGGGLVPGSLLLLGGAPGIGKSTLLLKIAANLAQSGKRVLYVSAEESASQIKMRADRLNACVDNLYLLSESSFTRVKAELAQKYEVLIIDSIQTIYKEECEATPGSTSQLRELTFDLMRLTKSQNLITFIIGHVTKDGSLAGPRVLEHMVDVVLYFDGEASRELRILRGFKNRFGATSEIGIFEMSAQGLVSAKDAKSRFFSRFKSPGSAVAIVMEGSRALAIEIQALVCESQAPKRLASGFDKSRLDIILALLEKKLEIALGRNDVFVNVSGGVKITESGADLALAMAILSSYQNRALNPDSAFLGELSLNGEIKPVSNMPARVAEAKNQKFLKLVAPIEDGFKLELGQLKLFKALQLGQLLDWM